MSKNWKVKVYLLNNDGNWSDYGAGKLNLERQYDEKQEIEIEYLKVKQTASDQSEQSSGEPKKLQKLSQSYKQSPQSKQNQNDKSDILLFLKINKENDYDMQGDSIITWVDKDIDEEVALSFLDYNVSLDTWRHICQVIGKNPKKADDYINEQELQKIPIPDNNNIEKVYEAIQNHTSLLPYKITSNGDFLDALCEQFQVQEDLMDPDENEVSESHEKPADFDSDDQQEKKPCTSAKKLEYIYLIFKQLVLTNDPNILKALVSDEFYINFFGAFEFNPDNVGNKKVQYRDFLQQTLKFKEIMKINNKQIQKKIHQNYRLLYLKDSVIASYIEDTTTNSINSITFQNNIDIFNYIVQPEQQDAFQEFFSNFTLNIEDSIRFLWELINITKQIAQSHFQQEQNSNFPQKLVQVDIFKILCVSCQKLLEKQKQSSDDQEIQKIDISLIHLLEILTFLINSEIKDFIQYLLSTENSTQSGKNTPDNKEETLSNEKKNSEEIQTESIQNQKQEDQEEKENTETKNEQQQQEQKEQEQKNDEKTENKENNGIEKQEIEQENSEITEKQDADDKIQTEKSIQKNTDIDNDDDMQGGQSQEETKKIIDNSIYKDDAGTFLNVIGKLFISKGTGVQIQIGQEIIKALIDPYNEQKNYIFDVVFQNFINVCVEQFVKPTKQEWYTSFATQFIDIITMVLKTQQKYKLETFLTKEKIFQHFKTILTFRNKTVNLSVIKFYRSIFSSPSNDKIKKTIIKKRYLDPIIELFLSIGNRKNLLNSSLLDLFETIVKSEDLEAIQYIVDNWWDQLVTKKLDHLFKSLHEKYQTLKKEQNNSEINKEQDWSSSSLNNFDEHEHNSIENEKSEIDQQEVKEKEEILLKFQQKKILQHKKEQEDEEDSFLMNFKNEEDSKNNTFEYSSINNPPTLDAQQSLSKSLIKDSIHTEQQDSNIIEEQKNNENNKQQQQKNGIEIGLNHKRTNSSLLEDNEDEDLQLIQKHMDNRKIIKTESEIDTIKSSPNNSMIIEENLTQNNNNQQQNNKEQDTYSNNEDKLQQEEIQQIQQQNQQQNSINMNINIEQESQ